MKERKKKKGRKGKREKQDKRMHPLPKEYAIAGKNGSVACIVSFHVARSIPIGQARPQVGSIVEVVCSIHTRGGTRDARRNGLRIKLSIIINNDVPRRVSLFFRIDPRSAKSS